MDPSSIEGTERFHGSIFRARTRNPFVRGKKAGLIYRLGRFFVASYLRDGAAYRINGPLYRRHDLVSRILAYRCRPTCDDATFPREYTDLRFIVFRYSNDIPGYIVAALATFRTDPERDTSLSLLDADNGSSTWWPGPSLFQIRYQLSRLAYNRQSKS